MATISKDRQTEKGKKNGMQSRDEARVVKEED